MRQKSTTVACLLLICSGHARSTTYQPTESPTHLPSTHPTLSMSPSTTVSPTMKPTEFPTDIPHQAQYLSALESLAFVVVIAAVALFIKIGNDMHDEELRQKKNVKIRGYNDARSQLYSQILLNASPADLVENIEVMKRKYWPGDLVVTMVECFEEDDLARTTTCCTRGHQRKLSDENPKVIEPNVQTSEAKLDDTTCPGGAPSRSSNADAALNSASLNGQTSLEDVAVDSAGVESAQLPIEDSAVPTISAQPTATSTNIEEIAWKAAITLSVTKVSPICCECTVKAGDLDESMLLIPKDPTLKRGRRGVVCDPHGRGLLVAGAGDADLYLVDCEDDDNTVDGHWPGRHLHIAKNCDNSCVGTGACCSLKRTQNMYLFPADRLIMVISPLYHKMLLQFPDRDWDEEELEEMEDNVNSLMYIVELICFPLRVIMNRLCCQVSKIRKIDAVANTDNDNGENKENSEPAQPMIEGFPIDCGTKDRKFLSMAKCKAVKASRHPHREVVDSNQDTYIQPFELWRDVGQHNVDYGPLREFIPHDVLVRPEGILAEYGLGLSLYFKFVKTMSILFMFVACFAIIPMSYYYSTSAWTTSERDAFMGVNNVVYGSFFTSIGSMGGQSFACSTTNEGELLTLKCPSGVINRLEAYFGDPFGSCSCPAPNQVVPSTGNCPASPDFTSNSHGDCTERYSNKGDPNYGKQIPCFIGKLWDGAPCCSTMLMSGFNVPDLSKLAMMPSPGCNSASAQFILQGLCLGRQNCSLVAAVGLNRTFTWTVSKKKPCFGGRSFRDSSGVEFCSAAFDSIASDFSECPMANGDPKRKLIARASCAQNSFRNVKWINDGKKTKRAHWAQGMSWLDSLLTCVVFWVVLWLGDKEFEAISINDAVCCSADDYTLRVMRIPSPPNGHAPDLNRLRRSLERHFETFAAAQPIVMMDRPIRVVDINFGSNNQNEIRDMKIRGSLARLLDLQQEKLAQMMRNDASSEKEVYEQTCELHMLKASFIQICEVIKFRRQRLEARTVFVTFDSEEGYERVRRAYCAKKSFKERWTLFRQGAPKLEMWKEKHVLDVQEVAQPNDYIWENVSTPPVIRLARVSLSNFLSLLILLIGFAVINKLKRIQAAVALKLEGSNCAQGTYVYNGDPTWSGALREYANSTGVDVTRVDVVKNVWPFHYNVSTPNSQLASCYCSFVLGLPEGYDLTTIQFRSPTGNFKYLCEKYFQTYKYAQSTSLQVTVAVVIINEVLKQCFAVLVEFEGHETLTERLKAQTIKLFASMLLMTAFLSIIFAGNLDTFTGGRVNGAVQVLSATALFSGSMSDFSSSWYENVGASIAAQMFVNVYALHIPTFLAFVKLEVARFVDRGYSLDMSRTNQKLQVHLENLYTGPSMMLEVRYASLVVTFFICVMFSGGMPVLWVVAALSFMISLCVDKLAFLRFYRLPPKYGPALAQWATGILPIAILMHALLASWAFSNGELFDSAKVRPASTGSQASNVVHHANMTDQVTLPSNANLRDYWRPPLQTRTVIESGLRRVFGHPSSVPQALVVVIWGIWFLTTKVLNIDDVIEYFEEINAKAHGVAIVQASLSTVVSKDDAVTADEAEMMSEAPLLSVKVATTKEAVKIRGLEDGTPEAAETSLSGVSAPKSEGNTIHRWIRAAAASGASLQETLTPSAAALEEYRHRVPSCESPKTGGGSYGGGDCSGAVDSFGDFSSFSDLWQSTRGGNVAETFFASVVTFPNFL